MEGNFAHSTHTVPRWRQVNTPCIILPWVYIYRAGNTHICSYTRRWRCLCLNSAQLHSVFLAHPHRHKNLFFKIHVQATATSDDVGSLYRLRRGKPHPLATTTAQHAGAFPPPKPALLNQARVLIRTFARTCHFLLTYIYTYIYIYIYPAFSP